MATRACIVVDQDGDFRVFEQNLENANVLI